MQFREWLEYYELEPPWYDDDLRTGQIVTILAEINRDRDARKTPFTVEDFMPRLKEFKRRNRELYGGGDDEGKHTRAMGIKEWQASKVTG